LIGGRGSRPRRRWPGRRPPCVRRRSRIRRTSARPSRTPRASPGCVHAPVRGSKGLTSLLLIVTINVDVHYQIGKGGGRHALDVDGRPGGGGRGDGTGGAVVPSGLGPGAHRARAVRWGVRADGGASTGLADRRRGRGSRGRCAAHSDRPEAATVSVGAGR